MDQSQSSSLLEVLAIIPDPRKARGKRYAWTLLLTLIAAGLASGQQTTHVIAQWVVLQADQLRAALPDLEKHSIRCQIILTPGNSPLDISAQEL